MCMCVCVSGTSEQTLNFGTWLDYYYIKISLAGDHRGSGGSGSVINENTSPGPVQTYLQDFGGAPGHI